MYKTLSIMNALNYLLTDAGFLPSTCSSNLASEVCAFVQLALLIFGLWVFQQMSFLSLYIHNCPVFSFQEKNVVLFVFNIPCEPTKYVGDLVIKQKLRLNFQPEKNQGIAINPLSHNLWQFWEASIQYNLRLSTRRFPALFKNIVLVVGNISGE